MITSSTPRVDLSTRIETPENVWLTFQIAGPGTRLGAYFVDLGLRGALTLAVSSLVGVIASFDVLQSFSTGAFLLMLFALEWLYGVGFEGLWSGRTPGKRMLGLRVIRTDGCPITFYDALLRNLLRAADALPLLYGFAFLSAFTSRRFQRLGDRVAGTMVIAERRSFLRRDLEVLQRVEPFFVDEIRSAYRPPQAVLLQIETLLRRRRELPRARVQELSRILAEPLGERLGFDGVSRSPLEFLLRTLRTFSGEGLVARPTAAAS